MSSPLDAATDTIRVENLAEWKGQDVVDPRGEKLGKLEEIYHDGEVDQPAFVAVKSGVVGKHLTLVPLMGASVGRDYVRVRADKKQFKDAPSFDTDAELTLRDERSAYRFFGLEYEPAGQNARRLAKR